MSALVKGYGEREIKVNEQAVKVWGALPYDGPAMKGYLNQELGIALDSNREASMIRAIKNPDEYVKRRNDYVQSALEKTAATGTQYLDDLLAAGVPTETAKAMTLSYTKSVLDSQMNIYNIANPGYDNAFRSANMTAGYNANIATMQTREAGVQAAAPMIEISKEQKRAIIAKYKAKKKAKMAALSKS
jgi:hypothetical protein